MKMNSGDNFEYMKGTLPLIKCNELTFTHGFSTREGGVSTDRDKISLDLGSTDGTDVTENRKRFASALSSDIGSMFFAKQIHSDRIERVTRENIGQQFECDGFVTNEKGLLLTVKVADCVPILLEDSNNTVIAAVHAGWRGTVKGIVLRALEEMEKLGAKRESIKAAIGPSIHSCCYEVDDPFVSAVKSSPCAESALKFITPTADGKYRASLQDMNYDLLSRFGVKNISVTSLCTCCNKDFFFSHRGLGAKRGLMMAGIIIDG